MSEYPYVKAKKGRGIPEEEGVREGGGHEAKQKRIGSRQSNDKKNGACG